MLSAEGLNLRDHRGKLSSPYLGPFAVTAVVNANAYTLALPPQLAALHPTFNISRLKAYRAADPARFPGRPQRYERPPPVALADSNGDTEWIVDRILAQRKHGRSTQYLVAWRGYPAEDNTWEPLSTVRDLAALDEFEAQQLAEASED